MGDSVTERPDQQQRGHRPQSTFLVHLTRPMEGKSARENLIEILFGRQIEARNMKGMFYRVDEVRHQTRAVCFSEMTLENIKGLVGKFNGRETEMSPYGLVFSKDFLIHKGANPVFYVNTYFSESRKKILIETVRQMDAERQRQIAPYMDIFGWTAEGGTIYDFHWEHEWRHVGNFGFEWKDVIFGLCEDELIDEMEQSFEGQIRFISPFMGLEEIIGRLMLNREETSYAALKEHGGT